MLQHWMSRRKMPGFLPNRRMLPDPRRNPIEEEAQDVDEGGDEEEEEGGDSSEEREVEGENEVGSGEDQQVEPPLSEGISCPHPCRKISNQCLLQIRPYWVELLQLAQTQSIQ